MHNINFDLKKAILQILAEDYTRDFTLEELTEVALPAFYNKIGFSDKELHQNIKNQPEVLNVLLFLEKRGLVVLNSTNDQCCITIRGYTVSSLDLFDLMIR